MELPKHWTEEDVEELSRATDYRDFLPVVERVIARVPRPRVILCGPISTGGRGSIEENLKSFTGHISEMERGGLNVFDQTPLEDHIQRIIKNRNDSYPVLLLEDVFCPVFEAGQLDELYFHPEWETSRGARWEHEQAGRLGIKTIYLNEKEV